MHPMHALPARDPMQQQQQHQVQIGQDQDQQNTMTVLETLNPVQQQQQQHSISNEQQAQVMGMIDPVQAQGQQHIVQQQHLVQQQQQQPHLHQLQPSQQTIEQALNADDRQQPSHQHQHPAEQRPQIISGEGIVADSGGPIVQWLLENYEIAEGESLPRSTVYNHYLAHCRQLQMTSVNAASFGKLIRSVFVGLKTRRLGTRGHSKYHYFGVRAKQHVQHELLLHQETGAGGGGSSSAGCSRTDHNDSSNHRTEDGSESDTTSLAGADCRLSSAANGQTKRIKRSSNPQPTLAVHNKSLHQIDHQYQQQQQHQHTIELASNGLYYATNNGIIGNTNGYGKHDTHNGNNQESPTLDATANCDFADSRNHLGANWATLVDEHWPARNDCQLEQQLIGTDVGAANHHANNYNWPIYLQMFETKYKSYYKRMVELLSELKFSEVEQLWQQFWRPPAPENNGLAHRGSNELTCWTDTTISSEVEPVDSRTIANSMQEQQPRRNGHQQQIEEYQQQQVQELTFDCLYQLTSHPLVVERINQIDYSLFAAIESFLFPDMLSPIPEVLRQQIRMFANNIGPYIELAVKDYEPKFVVEKSKSARAFGNELLRYTKLNRLSSASREGIWEKRSSLTQLSMDLSRIDLRYIEHQVSLMSNHGKLENLITRHSNHHRQESTVAQSADKIDTGSPDNQTSNISADVTKTAINKSAGIGNNENLPGEENNHRHHNLCAMQPGQLIQNFLHLLEDPYPANSWPDWCRNLFESRVCGLSMEEAKNFLNEWKNYISCIENELIERSAPSLASFLLIKPLFDGYIDYLVVTRLAQAQHKTRAYLSSR